MNGRVRQAMLRILLLTQEFSPKELSEAVALISEQTEEDLFNFLKQPTTSPKRSTPRSGKAGISKQGETKALQELKSVDEEKYKILRELETAIREGEILTTLDEFRALGKVISKDFNPGKSRKEALGRLMALLAQMNIDAIRSVIVKIPSKNVEEENSFRRLANQIISGSRGPPSDGPS